MGAVLWMRSAWCLSDFLLILNLLCGVHSYNYYNRSDSIVAAYEPGSVIVGGLFPVHEKGDDTQTCGAINKERGVQRLEAMLFTVDEINRNTALLPGIKLGVMAFDTCGRSTYALEQSLEFLQGLFLNMEGSDYVCDDGSRPRPLQQVTTVAGVIGGSDSSVSIQVANLLRLFNLPQISYASTSAALSDKRYDYFVRTVPPDTFQAKAMVDIVEHFHWKYVSTVASSGEYGEPGIDFFQKEARARNICIATSEKIPNDADNHNFDTIIETLLSKKNAKVVILFLRVEDARQLLDAATRKNITDKFVWVASDGWGRQQPPVLHNDIAARGALTIELMSARIPGFDDYFLNIDPRNNERNPWFKEYWESVHHCKWVEKGVPPKRGVRECKGTERLTHSNYKQESKVQFIFDAVYAIAYALDKMQRHLCPTTTGICPEMKKIDGELFLRNYILNTSFDDGFGAHVSFDKHGDAPGRYSIMNFQRNRETRMYEYKIVGNWTNTLNLDVEKIVWSGGTNDVPESQCSKPCRKGEAKNMRVGDTCCWICIKCQSYEYLKDEFTCEDCGFGRWPHLDKMGCYDLELQYMSWDSIYAIIPICLSCFGMMLTFVVIIAFILHHKTPIVMASGKELSYMLLVGCLFCYLMTFILLAKPSAAVCAIQRFGVGFGFSIVYSSLLTKTNRISRIFDSARRTAKRPPFISPKSQIVIASILVSFQILFTIVWLILEPPGTRKYLPNGQREEVILKCKTEDLSFLVSLVYNMLLIIICTVYAVKTRKIPENFNESKFIGFAMYTTCIIWLAFVPIYFGTLNTFKIQITTLCISISLSATVALVCLFSPKIYVIVFQPEKNVRKLTMNSGTYKKAPTGSFGTTCTTTSTTNNIERLLVSPVVMGWDIGSVESHPSEHIKLNVQSHRPGLGTATETDTDRDSLASL